MTVPAIRVEGLWKEYVIGAASGTQTFREALTETIAAPFRRLRRGGTSDAPEQRFWALQDVNFEVQPGEVVGIIGRNGAGKSTLLKILSRITAPTRGEVQIRGRIASLLEVGTGFHPELTGRENIRLNGAILGMTGAEIRSKFDEIVAFAGVEKFIDTPVKRYSSGMYVRLAFAVAAHLEPEILVIDEVLAVGDAEFQKKCLGKMGEVARGGRTVLFVSHNLPVIESLCPSSIWLDKGSIAFFGSTSQAITKYRGSPRINYTACFRSTPRASGYGRHFKSASISAASARDDGRIYSGDDLCLRISFESSSQQSVNRPNIGFTITHEQRGLVGGLNSGMSGAELKCTGNVTTQVECLIRNPRLLPGIYRISLWLGQGRADIDALEDALVFEVHAADVFRSGILPNDSLGQVYFDADWRTI